MPLSEADTSRKFIIPKLQASGWDNDPHSIAEQRSITDGRIVPVGKGFVRKPPKRVDYLLRYERYFPLAVVGFPMGNETLSISASRGYDRRKPAIDAAYGIGKSEIHPFRAP